MSDSLGKRKKRPEPKPLYRGPNRGLNRPVDVLAFIEVTWQRTEIDPAKVATEMGYTPTQIRRLKERHGDQLLFHLQKVQRHRADRDRFMARQQGRRPHQLRQYVDSAEGSIDELPTIPKHYEAKVDKDARARAEDLYESMCDVEKALASKLEKVRDPLVEGELRRALVQVRKATAKAHRALLGFDLKRAA